MDYLDHVEIPRDLPLQLDEIEASSLAGSYVHEAHKIIEAICAERRAAFPEGNGEEVVLYAAVPGTGPVRVASIGSRRGSLVEILIDDGTGTYLVTSPSQVSISVRFERPLQIDSNGRKEIGFHTKNWKDSIRT